MNFPLCWQSGQLFATLAGDNLTFRDGPFGASILKLHGPAQLRRFAQAVGTLGNCAPTHLVRRLGNTSVRFDCDGGTCYKVTIKGLCRQIHVSDLLDIAEAACARLGLASTVNGNSDGRQRSVAKNDSGLVTICPGLEGLASCHLEPKQACQLAEAMLRLASDGRQREPLRLSLESGDSTIQLLRDRAVDWAIIKLRTPDGTTKGCYSPYYLALLGREILHALDSGTGEGPP